MDFRVPELGEGVYEAELLRWLVQPGNAVKRGQSLMEVMTDKATMEVPAPFAGTVTELKAQPGQQIKVGEAVLSYTPAGAVANEQPPEPQPPNATPVAVPVNGAVASPRASQLVKAAPSVRLMARKLGIELGNVHGSGPDGRILIEDVTANLPRAAAAKPASAEPRLDYGQPGTRMKLQGLRRRIAEHMVTAKRTIPHYSYVDECDVTDLVRLRESLREPYGRAGVKLTYLAFVVKAVVGALKEVPLVNASLDEQAGEIVLHDRYQVGVAVATSAGLIVPVIHDADRKDLGQIAREIETLSAEARAGKSRRDDLRGGTFTVTSIGGIGGLISTPVINHPEVGILGIGKIVRRPVYDAAGNIRPADLLYLSFSFDHRVVDGAIGAVFGNAVISRLQNPGRLLIPEAS